MNWSHIHFTLLIEMNNIVEIIPFIDEVFISPSEILLDWNHIPWISIIKIWYIFSEQKST